jgi:hypothetical protein
MKDKPGLREIELAMTRLWSRRAEREKFLAGEPGVDNALARHIDPRGVKIYANLIDLNRLDLMASIYPHCKKLLGKNFRTIVFDYMETMPPDHFNFNQAARKFSQYLTEHGEAELKKRPFLAELADYEWIELAVIENDVDVDYSRTNTREALAATVIDPVQFAQTVPRLNPTTVLRAYRYPIATIVDALENDIKLPRRQKLEASWSLAFRNSDHLCEYLEISEMTYILLNALAQNPALTYGEMIAMACAESNNAEETVTDFLAVIEQLSEEKVFI